MYGIEQESLQLCDKMINKYSDNFVASNFTKNELIKDENLNIGNTILAPSLNYKFKGEENNIEGSVQLQEQ